MVGKRVQFDDETWQAIDAAMSRYGLIFQSLFDEAFKDLLKKHVQPVTDKVWRGACCVLGLVVLGVSIMSRPSVGRSEVPKGCAQPTASSVIINVKDKGASGDGQTDDTAAIQAAIDAAGGTKATVLVPDGTYMVDAVGSESLKLKSDMTLKLADGATLKAIPNDAKRYAVLTISEASNVWVTGGALEGERHHHKGKSGEWGMGIHIGKNAAHVTISQLISRNMWGDGFYVQGAEDVKFCSVIADGNRRQGLSIIDANGVLVLKSVFKNTHGTRPSAGIDLEPNDRSQEIKNVRVENSRFFDNAGAGILVAGKKGPISNVEMTRNTFRGNRPFVVENAPAVAARICGNRQTSQEAQLSGGLNAYAGGIEIHVVQNACGETSFVVNREKKRKKPRR